MQQEATHISRPVDDKIMEFVVLPLKVQHKRLVFPLPSFIIDWKRSISSPVT